MPQLYAALSQPVAIPVDYAAGFVCPELHQILFDVSCRISGGHGHILKLVDLCAPFLLIAGIDRAKVVADAHAGGEAVDTDDFRAFFRSGSHGEHAAGTAADDQDIGLKCLRDLRLVDLGFGSEPVAVLCLFFLGDDLNFDLTFRLRDAVGSCFLYGRGGNGRA